MDPRDIQVFDALARAIVQRLLVGLATVGWMLLGGLVYVRIGSEWLLALAFCAPGFVAFLLAFTLPVRRRGRLRDSA